MQGSLVGNYFMGIDIEYEYCFLGSAEGAVDPFGPLGFWCHALCSTLLLPSLQHDAVCFGSLFLSLSLLGEWSQFVASFCWRTLVWLAASLFLFDFCCPNVKGYMCHYVFTLYLLRTAPEPLLFPEVRAASWGPQGFFSSVDRARDETWLSWNTQAAGHCEFSHFPGRHRPIP